MPRRVCQWGSRCAAAVLLAAVTAVPAGAEQGHRQPRPKLRGLALVEALQHGGHVVYLRHASTIHEQQDREDVEILDLDDCSKQRNLSDEGRKEAAELGRAFAAFRIPVGEVLSSPYCRCADTATLAFGRAEKTDDLSYAEKVSPEERVALGEALRRRLAAAPAAGQNTVLVSHTANLKEISDVWPETEGQLVAFRPDGRGGFSYIGKLTPTQWADLLARVQ